jgi:long-chain acyl-CoA synthetase
MSARGKTTVETGESEPGTLPAYFRRNLRIWGDRVAMRQKDYGIWQKYTWKQCYEISKHFGLGMLSLGARRGDKVCLLGDNEVETYWIVYGLYGIGAVVVGIWVDALPDEAVYYLTDSESRFIIVRDQEQVDKMLGIRDKVPLIKKLIWWEPKGMSAPVYKNDPWIMGLWQVIELGREYAKEHPDAFEDAIEQIKPDDIANMYYTAGTTGAAKGVVRSHTTQVYLRKVLNRYYPLGEEDQLHSIMQFASIGEPIMGSTANLMCGSILNFPESPDTSELDMREMGPSWSCLTPRYWEEIASKMRVKIDDGGFLKRGIFSLALPIGYKVVDFQIEGKKVPLLWQILRKIAWWIAFRPNLDKCGLLKMRHAGNSGFVLGQHTFRFFRAIGVDMREFYASTEVPLIATHWSGEKVKIGSIGKPVSDVEIRLSDDGELYIRGPHRFNEYYRKPEKTKAAIDENGWYHSGDAGYIDEDGYVFYIDRVTELAQLATGYKYSPQGVEAQIRFGAYIKDCWILGEGRDFVTGVITVDLDSVSNWAEKHHLSFTTMVDLSQKDEVADLVLKEIKRVNIGLPPSARIKKFAVFHKEFDADEAELTRTRKLRREYMYGKYRDVADGLYSNSEVIPVSAEFAYSDGTKDKVTANVKVRNVPET